MSVIRVCIGKGPELYGKLKSATRNHAQYEGCYVMQFAGNRRGHGRLIGEFLLREADWIFQLFARVIINQH